MIDDLIRDILAKLEMLADAPTQNLDPNKVHSSATKSKAPNGVGLRGDPNRPPDKDRVSLFEWYSWHFAAARAQGNVDRLRSLYLLAQVDYTDFRFRPDWRTELRKGELDERDIEKPILAEEESATRIVAHYEGLPSLYVAIIEGQEVSWVEKARRWNGRDPKTGKPRPEFYGWDEDRRREEIAVLAEELHGAQAIALRLGVAKATVQRYMSEKVAA